MTKLLENIHRCVDIALVRELKPLCHRMGIDLFEAISMRPRPSLSAEVSYHDPYFPSVGRGRHYDLNMKRVPLADLAGYDCILIATDHSDYDYPGIVDQAQLVVETRNASGIASAKIVRC